VSFPVLQENTVPVVSIVSGVLLIALGLWGYFGTDTTSPTALIPALFGAVLAILGALALNANMLKHAMHGAAGVGLLGFVTAGVRFVMTLVIGIEGKENAAISTGLMTLICGVFVALCVNSFIAARRRRQAAGPQGSA
jgi:hypothetical protein